MSPSNPPAGRSFHGAVVLETPALLGDAPVLVHPGWRSELPWLVQGTTRRGDGDAPFDLGLFARPAVPGGALERWERVRVGAGMVAVAHARQVHGSTVRHHRAMPPGFHLSPPCDGHACADAGVLLAVTTADCVPVSIVDAERRAVALVHAGWRGSAAGIVERGVATLAERHGSVPSALRAHLGPAICGRCYEVGPEVFEALGLPVPERPAPIDLRAVLASRLAAAGVPGGAITVSGHCTRCGDAGLFSHRAGDGERQAGLLGVRG